MVPIPFAVAAAPRGVHIAPSFKCEVPVGKSQHVKCHWLAVLGFSIYHLDAVRAKNGNKPTKASNLSLTILRVPLPNGTDFFCSGCGAPWGTNTALT